MIYFINLKRKKIDNKDELFIYGANVQKDKNQSVNKRQKAKIAKKQ